MPAVKYDLPSFSLGESVSLARTHFGLEATATSLTSERDQNIKLTDGNGQCFVLKIANATEDPRVIELQNLALEHVACREPRLALPRVCRALSGALTGIARDQRGVPHLVRLLTWVPGTVLARATPHTPDLLRSLGSVLGMLDSALATFSHAVADRDLKWDPRRAAWISDYVRFVEDPVQHALVERLFGWASAELERLGPALRVGVIYNDANDHNVLVGGDDPYDRRVVSVVDFGDMLQTWMANEVAVAAAYAMLDKPDPLCAATPIVDGYHDAYPLTDAEVEAIWPLACIRLCVSVVNSAYQRQVEPANSYLTISERPAWELLSTIDRIHPRLAHYSLRDACGLMPCPAAARVTGWLRSADASPGPVMDPDPRTTSTLRFDLGVGSCEAGTPRMWSDVKAFSRHLSGILAAAGAEIGIGHYDEVRAFYSSDIFRMAGNDGPEWRTVHIGLDLFAAAGTSVVAPLEGRVFSVADNAGPLDYGPTVILEHQAGADGPRFYSLYGHLQRESVRDLQEGQPVARGAVVARVGAPHENGGWPPHLHFQIVTDLLDRHGDFPGVARRCDRRVWLSLSPDPNLIAQIPDGVRAPRLPASDEVLAVRRERLGPSLGVSYRRPLTIVRGWMQHLYDSDGRAFLDAVNNVAHVGHCHPRIVEAGQRQMAVLNTNTRYLHDLVGRYAERLCATLPEPLRICFFVNSGSEANELALRLARAWTNGGDTIVVDTAYHGNTTGLIDVSPYKFDGPGGRGAPPHVHKVPTPDDYRGLYRAPDREAGLKYAAHVAETVERITHTGDRVAAFFAESILSCAGQVVLPPGYLAAAYQAVHDAGGVCIADEVQVGFGRVGSHVWAFETQGVVPDIVTLGKPIGNGHPLGAVVTTLDIARAFANGMEYFNTFGGNPVSCAIGLAVLDVLRDERLQEHARVVGQRLLAGLAELKTRHRLVGDVRGLGLFAGVELVSDRNTLDPATEQAAYVANRMRDKGVLVSTDGPFHNVLKIKPPMVFTEQDAGQLVSTLDDILQEDYCASAL